MRQNEKQQLFKRIQREIMRLLREFKELHMLKEAADEIKYYRKYFLTDSKQFD